MLSVQQHHAKLYFAGAAKNWELASYELDEIQELLDDAARFHPKLKDVKASIAELIPSMMNGGIRNVKDAITNKSEPSFTRSFKGLTASCNSCHKAAEHPFIVIQTPKYPEFSNQKFEKE